MSFQFTDDFLRRSAGYLPAMPASDQVLIAAAERERNFKQQESSAPSPQERLVRDFTRMFGPK